MGSGVSTTSSSMNQGTDAGALDVDGAGGVAGPVGGPVVVRGGVSGRALRMRGKAARALMCRFACSGATAATDARTPRSMPGRSGVMKSRARDLRRRQPFVLVSWR